MSLDLLLLSPDLMSPGSCTLWPFKAIQKEKYDYFRFADQEPGVPRWLVRPTQPQRRAEVCVPPPRVEPLPIPCVPECRGTADPTRPLMMWELPKLLQREHLPDGFSTGQRGKKFMARPD